MKLDFLVLICLTVSSLCKAQSINGIVLDLKTNAPIESAAVYFDNTTIGTSTNDKGEFEIEQNTNVTSDLIISFLGYEKVTISDYDADSFYKVLLQESTNTLDEVIITSFDGMSKALKLEYFRREFLGLSKAAQSCKILNEDDLILRFDQDSKQLTVYAKQPIQVQNDYLNYIVAFEIEQFYIDFSYVNIDRQSFAVKSIFYKGTSYYNLGEAINSKRIIKNRQKVYEGSVLHFMRALSKGQLKEENYTIASGGFIVNPEKYISVSRADRNALYTVKMRTPLSVFYKGELQSDIKTPKKYGLQIEKAEQKKKPFPFKDGDTITSSRLTMSLENSKKVKKARPYFDLEFFIDSFGNYSPIEAFFFIGHMGALRVGDSLPLDFELKDQK